MCHHITKLPKENLYFVEDQVVCVIHDFDFIQSVAMVGDGDYLWVWRHTIGSIRVASETLLCVCMTLGAWGELTDQCLTIALKASTVQSLTAIPAVSMIAGYSTGATVTPQEGHSMDDDGAYV